MKKFIILPTLIFCLFTNQIICDASNQNTTQDIFRDGSLLFSWKIDSTNKKIDFNIDADTTGWVGIGFSPDGTMTNADMILCYMSNSIANCSDRYSKGHGVPQRDSSINENSKDDLENVSGEIKNNRSIFRFTRNLNTGDNLDYQINQGEEINVIFSYRKDGNPDNENGVFKMHTKYGGEKFILYPNENQSIKNDDFKKANNTYKVELKFDNYEIPDEDTVYSCINFNIVKMANEVTKLPLGTVYHSIAYEPIIDNSEFLHHMLILSCTGDIPIKNTPYSCRDSPKNCKKIHFGWAPGSGIYSLPKDVGILWGVSENENIILQYHYDNPKKKLGQKDSSYVNVYFTTELRKFDAASTILGYPTALIDIPSNTSNYTINNTCSEPCTNLMKGDIYIFSIFLHGHNFLRKIRTEILYANGTLDNSTMSENNYRFDNQKFVYFKEPLKISPKDKFITYCTYDTSNSTDRVKGGDSSSEEMCLNVFSYYPRENGLSKCFGSIPIIYGCEAYNRFEKNSRISLSLIESTSFFLNLGLSKFLIFVYLVCILIV